MTNTDWPIKPCKECGVDIRLVKTRFGWAPYETERFEPHKCGERRDVFDHSEKIVPIFNPKSDRFKR